MDMPQKGGLRADLGSLCCWMVNYKERDLRVTFEGQDKRCCLEVNLCELMGSRWCKQTFGNTLRKHSAIGYACNQHVLDLDAMNTQ